MHVEITEHAVFGVKKKNLTFSPCDNPTQGQIYEDRNTVQMCACGEVLLQLMFLWNIEGKRSQMLIVKVSIMSRLHRL